MKNKKVLVISILILFLTLIIGCSLYVSSYYPANDMALEALSYSSTLNIRHLSDETLVFEPESPNTGFIFYPGGKVEYTAYAPLLRTLAENGILCILVKMPFNLAVLDVNAADELQNLYPEVENWYIGGHSLGGSMAASYLENHVEDYKGLVLLASYSTVPLNTTNLKVISIYGSNDQVLNAEKYQANRTNLPDDFIEYVIEGGSHAYFGAYGLQKGDGIATLSNTQQIEYAANFLLEHMQ